VRRHSLAMPMVVYYWLSWLCNVQLVTRPWRRGKKADVITY
jgi:hypothetical protein